MKKFYPLLIFIFFSVNAITQECQWIYVKGGKFKMGSKKDPDEQPVHKVKINDFYILNHEVTNAEFCRFLNIFGNKFEGNAPWIQLTGRWRTYKCRIYENNGKFYVEKGYENYPVTFVSWWGAEKYAQWIGGRLPTEAEWEYIASKIADTLTISSQNIQKYGWFKENSGYHLHRTKEKKSLNGIYDFFGNLSEWCYDWYSPSYYAVSPKKNPLGPDKGRQKVLRGFNWAAYAKSFYITNRRAIIPDENNITIGFRVVIPLAN